MGKLNEFVQNGKSVCRLLVLQNIIGIVMTQAKTSVFPTYRIEFSVVAPRSIIFRAFVTETVNGYWMDQWDITQTTKWGKFVNCKPDIVTPPIEAQFCVCHH